MSNSSSDDESEATASKGLNLAGFLFGNIDRDGKLEENFLDETSKKKLGGLSSLLGLGKLIEDEVKQVKSEQPEDYEEGTKAADAEDFSAINDALTDDSSSSDEDTKDEVKKEPVSPKKENEIDIDIKEEPLEEDEKRLMPPPISAPPPVNRTPAVPMRKPLASMLSMLPDKYKNVKIEELFPEFRENKVLRFSRLFPIKSSYKPRIWKNVKRRFKTEGEEEEYSPPKRNKNGEWLMNIAPPPNDPDAYVEDQAVRFHRPFREKRTEKESSNDQISSNSKRPQDTDWRFGPAQYWYDMLGLPDKAPEFNYGLKNEPDTDVKESQSKSIEKKEAAANIPMEPKPSTSKAAIEEQRKVQDDAFLMVTQSNWEDDVIWNGDDIKHKVLQKLNNKDKAAGWLPSSYNRTAGSMTGKLAGIKPQTMHLKKPLNDEEFYSIFPVENEELVYGRWEDEVIWDHEKMPVRLQPKMVTIDPNDDNIILGKMFLDIFFLVNFFLYRISLYVNCLHYDVKKGAGVKL